MLDLPRFTLLHGPRHLTYPFTTELLRRDPHEGLIADDLGHAILNGIIITLFDAAWLEIDTEKLEVWNRRLPLKTIESITIDEYFRIVRANIRHDLGEDILGQIYLKDYLINGYDEISPKVIIRDFDNAVDAQPFIARYGQSAVCCVHLDPLKGFKSPIHRNYYNPHTDPAQQVDYFIHEIKSADWWATKPAPAGVK